MKPLTNQQKAAIHVAKGKVGMSDEEYRAMLSSFGVSSSTQLTNDQFKAVMKRFEKLGFVSKFNHRGRRKPARDKEALMSKIGAILADMGLPWAYADGIAKKQAGVDMVQFCDPDQLYKVVQSLIYHQKRHGGKRVKRKGGRRC